MSETIRVNDPMEKLDQRKISSIGAMMTMHRGNLFLKEMFAMKFKIVTIFQPHSYLDHGADEISQLRGNCDKRESCCSSPGYMDSSEVSESRLNQSMCCKILTQKVSSL